MGTSTTQDECENQEEDGRTLSRKMHYRSQVYKIGESSLGLRRTETTVGRSQGPDGAVAPYKDG